MNAVQPGMVSYDQWKLVYKEEFDKPLDRNKWNTSYIWDRSTIINRELQHYIDWLIGGYSPFSQKNGMLYVEATETPPELLEEAGGQPYLSGLLTSRGHYSQRYGRIEARIQSPWGRGLWPAFWLLPELERWPEGVAVLPEVDIMELLGHDPKTYYATLHSNVTPEKHYSSYHSFPESLSQGFRIYGFEWDALSMKWYIDDQYVFERPTPDDHREPKHFLLNLAVGGNWPGNPDDSTPFPAQMKVDWVRGWQKPTAVVPRIGDNQKAVIRKAISDLESLL